jgi:hypothetical protein
VLLLTTPLLVLAGGEAGVYRALGWRWRAALVATVPSLVLTLGAGFGLMVALGRYVRLLGAERSFVLAGVLGWGLAALAVGAPLAARLAPRELRRRDVYGIAAGVKVLLLALTLSGVKFTVDYREAAEPPPRPRLHAPPPARGLQTFAGDTP